MATNTIPLTKWERAFIEVLVVAIVAPSEAQSAKAVALADSMADSMSATSVTKCQTIATEQLGDTSCTN